MTAPPAPRTPRAAPLAGDDVGARAFRAEARYWHGRWAEHVCRRCELGGRCRMADYYASQADAANERLLIAEARARR